MPSAKWTVQAELDLEGILYYIAFNDRRLETAERVGKQMRDKCELLATQPHMGDPRPDLGEGYRLSHFKRWIIIFRPMEDGIEVMRIIDGARDYSKLFGQ